MNLPEGYTLDEPMKADAGNASLPDGFTLDTPVVSDIPEGFTLDNSPPAETSATSRFLSGESNPQGVLPLADATDAGSVAFKAALEKAKSESALKTFGREFITHIAPATVGAVSSLGGAAVGAAGGPVGVVAGDIAAGIAGEAAGTKLQRSMYSPEELVAMDAQEAVNAKEHGFASQMGSLLGEVPMMLTGAFFAKKLALAGIKGAGKAATEEAVKEATGKLGSKLTTSATTFGAMGGAGAASEMVKQTEATPEGERIGYGDIAGETIKGGIGGLAIGGASEVLGKFVPAAKTYLGGIGIRAPTDALVLTVANNLYDTIVHGKAFEPYEVLKGTAAETPAFMIMNAIMGGHAINRARPQERPTEAKPVAVATEAVKPEPVPWGAQDVNAKINAEVAEAMPGTPKSGYDAMQEQTDINAKVADIHNELNPDAPIEPAPVEQGNIFEPLKQPPPAEPQNIQPLADTTIPAQEGAVPSRTKYVVPETPVARMGVKALREELKAGGIETTTRDKISDLRYRLNQSRTDRLAQEKRMQALETRAPQEVKIESAETTANRQRGQQDGVSGHSDKAAGEQAQFLEDKIRRHIDDGRYLNDGETVYDAKGVEHEVVGVDRFPSQRTLGKDELTYEVRDMTTGETKKVSGAELSRELDRDVPFRTVLNEAKGGDAGRAKWIIRKTLGKDSPVEIVDRIFEKGAERLGKYQAGLVTIAKNGNMERTAYHEAFHGAKDMLMTAKERNFLDKYLPGEEAQADAFMDYAAGKQGVTGQLKMYFDRMMYRIKKLFGAADGISELKAIHAKLMQGSMAKRGAKAGTGEVRYSADIRYRTAITADTSDPTLVSAVGKANKMLTDTENAMKSRPTLTNWRKIKDMLGINFVDQQMPYTSRLVKTGEQAAREGTAPRTVEGTIGEKVVHQLKAEKHMGAQAERRVAELGKEIHGFGLKTRGELDELGIYLNAKRTLELGDVRDGEAFKSPFTQDEATALVTKYENRHPKSEAFKKSSDAIQKNFRASLDLLLEAGTIQKKVYDDLKDKFYMPRWFIDKYDPIVRSMNTKMGEVGVRQSGIKALKSGSDMSMITDPFTLIAQNTVIAENVAAKNKTMLKLQELIKQTTPDQRKNNDLMIEELSSYPDKNGKPVFDEPKPGFARVDYWDKGQKKAFSISKDLANTMEYSQGLDPSTANIIRLASGNSFVKFMATAGNLEFALGNIPRDWGLQYLAGDSWSSFIPKALLDQGLTAGKLTINRALKKALRDGYYKYGGESGYLSSGEVMNMASKDPQLLAAQGLVKNTMKALSYVGNKSEELSRLMNVHQALKKMNVTPEKASPEQWQKAVHEARSIMDFSDHGKVVKFFDTMIPFLNPAFQGARAVSRAFKNRPVQTTMKAAQLVAGATALYYYARKNDEQGLDSISQGDMISKLNIPLGATSMKDGEKQHAYVGIPIDQGWRPFIVFGKMLADKMHGKEVDPAILKKTILANYVPGDINNFPPVLAALWAYANNFDMWKGDKIWKGRDVTPEFEYTARTPERYVKAGSVLGMSPERMRIAESKIFPNNPLTYLRDKAFDMFSGEGRDSAQKDMWQELSDLPGSRKYIRLTSPRSLTSDQQKAAKRLGVETKGRAEQRIFEDIKKREQSIASYRQKNDVTFDKLVAKVRSSEMTKAELYKAAWQVKSEAGKFDGKERVRILRRLKERYPEAKIIAPSGE